MAEEFEAKVEDLRSRRLRNLEMGGSDKIARQHERGKLTVRERIDLLFDPGSFVEFGLLAHQQALRGQAVSDPSETPADGVVTGHGLIDGRQAWVIVYDFT